MGTKKPNLKARIGGDFIDFAEHTSAHGIPRAYVSTGCRRVLWLALFLLCFASFMYQAYLIILRFLRNDIIVNVEIRYKDIDFPSVTVCNLNPYKTSRAMEFGSVKDTLESLNKAMKANQISTPRLKRALNILHSNQKLPVAADVYCKRTALDFWEPSEDEDEKCTCASLLSNSLNWLCRPSSFWQLMVCSVHKQRLAPANSSQSTVPCACLNDHICALASDFEQVRGKTPIVLKSTQCHNSSDLCLCISIEEYETNTDQIQQFCAPYSQWSLSTCGSCDWWGRCFKSSSLAIETDCVCHRNARDKCFEVEAEDLEQSMSSLDPVLPRVRVQRHSKRIYEKILASYDGLLAVYTTCEQSDKELEAVRERDDNKSTCLCFYNKKNGHVWPCYKPSDWREKKCTSCATFGNCDYFENATSANIDCLCAEPINMCVRLNPSLNNETSITERVVSFWEILPTTAASPLKKKKEETEKAYNYVASDPVALNAQAKENVMFILEKLSPQDKAQMSYTKQEFITRCSFNGRDCSINDDFSEHSDPVYGTCFTFNHDPRKANLTSERAGPNYGLRFQVFVNIEEYMPTTEASGVRLTVHSADEQPFPDTHGYSAPTGFVSSFGIRMKEIKRLPAPYGDCIEDGKDKNFIYTTKNYSTEGCQRSCVQQHFVLHCGCGDPRYPPWMNSTSCPVDNPTKRNCLKRETEYTAKNIDKLKCKKCRQPCTQQVYSISYSASRWPATSSDRYDCPKGLSRAQCLHYLREQGAMIEVFFEQLNYEALEESEAYGWPNLLADFGGQLGLWMGVSVITISEVGLLILDLVMSLLGFSSTSQRKLSRRSFQLRSNRYSTTKSPASVCSTNGVISGKFASNTF